MAQTVRSAHFLFNSDKIGRDPCYIPGPRFTRSQSPEWRPHFIALILRQTRNKHQWNRVFEVQKGGITYTTDIKVSIPAVPSV